MLIRDLLLKFKIKNPFCKSTLFNNVKFTKIIVIKTVTTNRKGETFNHQGSSFLKEALSSSHHTKENNLLKDADNDVVLLFYYIKHNAKSNSSLVFLKHDTVAKARKMGRKRVSKAIHYLIEQQVIKPVGSHSLYWINPLFCYKGKSLLEFIETYYPDSITEVVKGM